ncbi:MAG: hypothetical protein DDT19_02631 [Syntrophomonadaceae bacterium]|nr:hypothetical protein [Bacillota bacterium]
MRDLNKSDKNKIVVHDAVSGSELELYYRTPTTSEMVQYQSKLFRRAGKKILINAFETRLEMGLQILTGFRDGDFGIDGKPISCNPNSENYREDWKELLKETAADVVTAVAFTVFEGARTDVSELEYALGEEEEKVIPFQKS